MTPVDTYHKRRTMNTVKRWKDDRQTLKATAAAVKWLREVSAITGEVQYKLVERLAKEELARQLSKAQPGS